jgi:aspartate/methionine/tyrosine aminotransferase
MRGLPELRQALSSHYRRSQGLDLDPETEILVTSGGTEAIAAALSSLIAPGDEVVVFQPSYDAYLPLIARAGGRVRLARLEPPDFRLTRDELSRVMSERTRLIVFNSPANPSARVHDPEELALLGEFAERHDARVLSDEVWEHVVFDGREHAGVLAQPTLRRRAIKVGSAGKMFSLTGWKVGFACGPAELISALSAAHQFLTFTTPPNLQYAVAMGLDRHSRCIDDLRGALERSRDRLVQGLRQLGFVTLPSQGTYFVTLDLAASGIELVDREFCFRAVAEAGVATLPFSGFYAEDPPSHLVRLCFSKTDETLDRGVAALEVMRRRLLGHG